MEYVWIIAATIGTIEEPVILPGGSKLIAADLHCNEEVHLRISSVNWSSIQIFAGDQLDIRRAATWLMVSECC